MSAPPQPPSEPTPSDSAESAGEVLAPGSTGEPSNALDARAQELTDHMARTCLGLRARAVSRKVTKLFDDELREHGLRATQFVLLGAIQNLGPLTATQLAERMAMGRSTLSRNLRPLVEAKWVEYRRGAGRAQLVTMLDGGRQLLIDASAAWRRGQAAAEALLGPSATAELTSLGTDLMREHQRRSSDA